MDSIRMALGQKQISYFGYSYGTYIGQVFATLFPHQLRRMVLDSTVDPSGRVVAGQHRAGLRIPGPAGGVLRLDGEVRQRLSPRHHRGRGERELVQGTRPAGGAPHPCERDAADRAGRVRRHDADRRLQQQLLARPRSGAVVLSERPLDQPARVSVRPGRHPERERVRRIQRGRVQRRELAPQLGHLEHRHQAGLCHRPVRGLGQRLVQRRLRVLAGAKDHRNRFRSRGPGCRRS